MTYRACIVIVGASHQGRIALDVLRSHQPTAIFKFVDDDQRKHGTTLSGVSIVGGTQYLLDHRADQASAFIAIGNNDVRCRIGRSLRSAGIRLQNGIHPSATLMSEIKMGSNVLICAGAVVVTGCTLEDDCVVNTGTTIDHDSHLHSGAYVAPGVHTAGGVHIGKRAFVGVGSVIGPGVSIGAGAIIGAGSVVLKDIPDSVFAHGAPARIVRSLTHPVDWTALLSGRHRRNVSNP